MIGWTLAGLLGLGVLSGLAWAVKGIDGSWAKAILVVAGITVAVAAFMAATYGVFALIEAGI